MLLSALYAKPVSRHNVQRYKRWVYMNSIEIDFNSYSTEQLYSALEGVDHDQYPDQALTIYQLLLNRLGLDYRKVDAESSGYIYNTHKQTIITRVLLAMGPVTSLRVNMMYCIRRCGKR